MSTVGISEPAAADDGQSNKSRPEGLYFPSPSKVKDLVTPWIDHATQQALLYRQTVEEILRSTSQSFVSRFAEIRSTSAAHFQQTISSLEDVKSDIGDYEDLLFAKLKEGVNFAASKPLITYPLAVGAGLVLLKRPRRFLYFKTRRLFLSEETLINQADARVKELRQSMSHLKAENEKLEKLASVAEEELIRGRTKLRQAGKQIQGAIRSAYKIERQAAGLKDILQELPMREASRMKSQVSNLASEAKKEKNALSKEVTKISSYGIAV